LVQFLLHNTIGAWWRGRHGIEGPPGGAGVPTGLSPVAMEYLRWRDDGTPAAGTFEGWPKTLAEFTMLDPCCGSGHFLVAGFNLLVPLRMHDEKLDARQACEAVLRDNLFGLELDPRCTQIAAFALALAAWTYRDEDGRPLGYRTLPAINIACSGQGVVGSKEDWAKLANGDNRFREGMERLFDLFQKAPTLGSLIDPRTVGDDLFALGVDTLRGTLDRALQKNQTQVDAERAVVGVAAHGIATAAALMARQFTLISTNVPYLARGRQSEELRGYIAKLYAAGKADLATAFLERCLEYCTDRGTIAVVSPQNWWMLYSYSNFRYYIIKNTKFLMTSSLGREAFDCFGQRGPMTTLLIASRVKASGEDAFGGIDAFSPTRLNKAELLQIEELVYVKQLDLLEGPDSRITLDQIAYGNLLTGFADCLAGILNGDSHRLKRFFWEIKDRRDRWHFQQSTVFETSEYGGREMVLDFDVEKFQIRADDEYRRDKLHYSDKRGQQTWRKWGVAVSQMDTLAVTLSTGELFDSNIATILPHDPTFLPAIWSFCKSREFYSAVRRIDQKVNVTNSTLVKVPFDLERWQKVAAEQFPNGLPEPHSDDPTQWLFKGHPNGSTDPLQVAVARLLGYCWPDQVPDDLDAEADKDGIVPIPGLRSEPPAAERLRADLQAAFVSQAFQHDASPNVPRRDGVKEDVRLESLTYKLLADAGCRPGTTLDEWLRTSFFEQHCKLFHNRPFIWHLWDGRKDGFSCLVNYHKLDHKALETLTYAYLQDWITAQAGDAKQSKLGADLRLQAAQDLQDKLKLILTGEPPFDIFVRWKPLSEQPIGWNPDLNDGVRLNIRPFITAGVLRWTPKSIKWTKDRGNEPEREPTKFPWFWKVGKFVGERLNDIHLTNAQKQAARGSPAGLGHSSSNQATSKPGL
jgi:hypothetical protein